MKDPNYAPVYCALYPALAEITRKHGYALSIHGTLGKDMDLVCIPWAEQVVEPDDVVKAIEKEFSLKVVGSPNISYHGRLIYTITVGFGECFIDLSFMPASSYLEKPLV